MKNIDQYAISSHLHTAWIGLGMTKKFKEFLAEGIRLQLRIHNISQKAFAERLNVAEATASRWVSGERLPRDDKIDEMCEIFGIDPIELLSSGRRVGSLEGKVVVDLQKLATEHGYIIKKKDS